MTKVSADRKKSFRTFRMLYYWGKFVGIVPIALTDKNEVVFSYKSLVYLWILCAAYSYVLYIIMIERFQLELPGETPISVILDFISIITGFLEIFLTWLIFGFYQNRIKLIVTSFARAENLSAKLNISDDYEKNFEKLGIYLVIVHILYAVWKIINNTVMGAFSNARVIPWICYTAPRVNAFSTWVIFNWSLVVIKEKFRRLNEKVRFLMPNDTMTTGSTRNSSYNAFLLSDKIDIISQLHRELRDIIYRIEDLFAPIILLNVLTQLTNFTFNAHVLYRFVKCRTPIKGTDVIYLWVIGTWLFIPVTVLTIISNVCGSTVDEANETGNTLHGMLNNFDYLDNRRGATGNSSNLPYFQSLSFDLLQNQVKMSLFGFLDLNSFLVYTIMATSTTHLTIMLQFYN